MKQTSKRPRRIAVLGTGGTIAGTAQSRSDHVGYRSAQLSVDILLSTTVLPDAVIFETEQVAQLDSKDMTFQVWRQLASRCRHWLDREDIDGIVITHGTDTLEETAFFLSEVLDAQKPVVLTCAMRPATALSQDGPQNLADAVTVASLEEAHGVVVVASGTVHSGRDVAKQHTYRTDALTSGDSGPIGFIEDGRLRLVRPWPPAPAQADLLLQRFTAAQNFPQVEILMSHASASGRLALAAKSVGVQGIVVAGTGNGTIHSALRDALLEVQEDGVKVRCSTRCARGHVLHQAGGLLETTALSPVKARIALVLELLLDA